MAATNWSPLKMFASDSTNATHALLILNCGDSMRGLENTLAVKWNHFGIHVCADGGANSLYDSTEPHNRNKMIPEFIIGDLDSIRPDVLEYYKEKGTVAISNEAEDNTDFTKSLLHIQSLKKYDTVCVVNTLWGRLDQMLGNICILFNFIKPKLYLVSETSVSIALQKGSHVINVDSGLEEGHCGFFPFCGPCESCTTTGCRWNLDGQKMEATGLFSSCNLIDGSQVTLTCSDPVLFTLSHKLVTTSS